jgi:predicted Zn-dependent protease
VADSPRVQELRRRIHQDPASLAFAPLAEELRRAGRLDEAVQICRAGLALHPEYTTARATLGRALIDTGDLDAALAELSAVLAAAPDHLSALKGVAEIQARRGEPVQPPPSAVAATVNGDDGPAAMVVRRLELFLERVLADRARRI